MNKHSPTLTLFCGLPGSGKTRIAKQVEQATNAVRLCTDDWMADLHLDPFDEPMREHLEVCLYELAKVLLVKNVDVILEDGLWSVEERLERLALAKNLGASTIIHVFDISPAEQWRRVSHRNKNLTHGAVPITKEQLESYRPLFELPKAEELAQYSQVHWYEDKTLLKI